jgi:nucleoid DNA-binding protein
VTKTIAEIVRRIARRHGVRQDLAGGFVYEAVDEIVRVLDAGSNVKIRGLGTLQWQQVAERPGSGALTGSRISAGKKLRFIPSKRFRSRRTKMSDSDGMTKYGVELDQEKTKQASEKPGGAGRCPTCSSKLDDAGACSVHGTEPLEPAGQPKRR